MSSVVIAGDTSGSITIAAPAVAGSNTLTLPAATGTVIYSNGLDNLLFNSGYGSLAVAYGCRAWVNFNGTGTVAIRASGNVTSITDNGTGNYTVNFTTAMPDANYSFTCSGRENTVGGSRSDLGINAWQNSTSISTSSLQVGTAYMSTAALFDAESVCIAIFR